MENVLRRKLYTKNSKIGEKKVFRNRYEGALNFHLNFCTFYNMNLLIIINTLFAISLKMKPYDSVMPVEALVEGGRDEFRTTKIC
jgi:hypothetical protein